MRLAFLVYLSSFFIACGALYRAASVGGTGGDPFDDIGKMGLRAEHDFRILNLLLWGEDDQAVPAFEASYLVLDGNYQGTQWPEKHDIYTHPEGHPRYYLTLESGDVIEWIRGHVGTEFNVTGGLFVLNSLTFSIRRANGSLEEYTVGKREGESVSIMGPVVGFWGGIAAAFDQLGVYVDPALWSGRPSRLIKYPLHGRLQSGSSGWSYFDDAEALGYPMVTRVVNITVVHSAMRIYGIGITYDVPFNGSPRYIEHGSMKGDNGSVTHIFLELGDYVDEMEVEVGAEEPTDTPDCLQFLQLIISKSDTDHKKLYSFGIEGLNSFRTSGRIVALHGMKDSTCIKRLGGHILAEGSLLASACPLPPAPSNGYLVNSPSRITMNSSVVFACDEGFELTQGGYLTCREDGFWDGIRPVCAQSSVTGACPLPPAPSNGYLVNSPSRITVNSSVVFACDEGFQLTQGSYLICREDGFWDGQRPVCAQSSATSDPPLKQEQQLRVGQIVLGVAFGLLCAVLALVLVCAGVTCLKLVKARKRISKSYLPEQIHYEVRESHEYALPIEPNNEAAQDLREEKLASAGLDFFDESDKSNLY